MTSSAITVENLKDLLICPITHEPLQDPVIDKCGHTFEKVDIITWLGTRQVCPLSREPLLITDLKPNYAVKDVIDVLARHNSNLDNLDDVERDALDTGTTQILAQRVADAAAGIPDRLPEDQRLPSLATRTVRAVKNYYGCA